MNRIDVTKRNIGVNFRGDRAEVLVWAPYAEKVEAETETERIQLIRHDFGYWYVGTESIKPGDRYRIAINNSEALADPASLAQPDGVHGPSQAIDIADFKWSDSEWINPPLADYIIYELHTGTFTDAGTFTAVIEKLDHLLELGVTAIEIMPVAEFPGNRNWGYDGVFPFAVHGCYGGARGLQQLINACHMKGMAVILDVVYNHLGPEGNYLSRFGPYFTNKYTTPWGPALNFDDPWCDGVREYFVENALMWFRDFHIDALRMDAVHAIKDFSPVHILKSIKECVNDLMKVTDKTYHLIVEMDLNDPKFITPVEQCGYGMDAQWIDEFHHALRVTAGGDRSGYYSDFNGIEDLAKSYRDAYVFDGQFSPHRKKHFGIKTDNPGHQFVVFSQNHDHVGNRKQGERSGHLYSFEMQKLLAGAVLVSPYIPMLFMGEEWSDQNPFLYFVSHTDPELAEAVRRGRKEEFAAFHSDTGSDEAPDPMDEESFNRSKLQWHLLKTEPHAAMLQYYKELIRLRKKHPAVHILDRKNLTVTCDKQKKTLTLQRWYENEAIVCLMNFSKTSQRVSIPEAVTKWDWLLNSADSKWKGPSTGPSPVVNGQVEISAESIALFTNSP